MVSARRSELKEKYVSGGLRRGSALRGDARCLLVGEQGERPALLLHPRERWPRSGLGLGIAPDLGGVSGVLILPCPPAVPSTFGWAFWRGGRQTPKAAWVLRGRPAPCSPDRSCRRLTQTPRRGREAHPPAHGCAAVMWMLVPALRARRG